MAAAAIPTPGATPSTSEAARKTTGTIAAAATTGYFGFLVAPPIIGGVAELTSLPLALGLLVLLSLVMAALAPRVRKPALSHA